MTESLRPWAIYNEYGRLAYLGLAHGERDAWNYYLPLASSAELDQVKRQGFKAKPVNVTPCHEG